MKAATADRFYKRLGDRTRKYGERPLDPDRRIALKGNPKALRTKAGQAAMLVAGELMSRMVRQIILDFDDVALVPQFTGPLTGSLQQYMLDRMREVAPFGRFEAGNSNTGDYVISIGDTGSAWLIDGSGWDSYVGPPPSPLPLPSTDNIFGSCLAAATAIARVFEGRFPDQIHSVHANLFTYGEQRQGTELFAPAGTDLGEIWFVGAGSVGSATAYFLAIAGYAFKARLFDMDIVKIENLDRSPIFVHADRGKSKTGVTARFLREFGLKALSHPHALDQVPAWKSRQNGVPDVLVSAANERNVRFEIENGLPPIQIYGTTGKDWQANVFRHIPSAPCSLCAFPGKPSVTDCAKGSAPLTGTTKQVDAALPFLSFAAGLMAAAEISKIALSGFPFIGNRGFYYPLSDDMLFVRPLAFRAGCSCTSRSKTAHARMIEGSRYSSLGTPLIP